MTKVQNVREFGHWIFGYFLVIVSWLLVILNQIHRLTNILDGNHLHFVTFKSILNT